MTTQGVYSPLLQITVRRKLILTVEYKSSGEISRRCICIVNADPY